jgi:hypothetical protein
MLVMTAEKITLLGGATDIQEIKTTKVQYGGEICLV